MSMCRVMLSSRFGGRSLFGSRFVGSLFTSFSRGGNSGSRACRGGVQVLRQASVFFSLHSVVFKSSFQLIGVGSTVGIGATGSVASLVVLLELCLSEALGRGGGMLHSWGPSMTFLGSYPDARRCSDVLHHHLFRDSLGQVHDGG